MKPVWVGIVFFLVYGLFSMKTQAAEGAFAADGLRGNEFRWGFPCGGE